METPRTESHRNLLSRSLRAAGGLVWDFRATFVAVALVLGICLAVQTEIDSGAVSRDQLMSSRTNLLGIVTSIFAHWDMTRLSENTGTLLFLTIVYPFTNFAPERPERARRSGWFAVLVFPLAVVVNILSILLSPVPSLGVSGLAMTGLGIAVAFFLINSVRGVGHLAELARNRIADPDERRRAALDVWWFPWNVVFFALYFYLLLFDRATLFGVGDPAINYNAHLIGFGMGFGVTALRFSPPRLPPRKRAK